ncbi:Inner membrane protein ylaC [Raoultella planticola]|uniref:Inner membrane protein ylaC n=1 Tax=Raoultella planticola TaxID=575 RepID=A0A485DAF8_RAOPL|nr:Inner membrane protein ylaC [Raoultella planticola]
MTEIQQLLTNTIDELNVKEKRDNRPRFSISFIRNHPWLFVAMYAAFLATFVVMLTSETLADSVWLLVVLFALVKRLLLFLTSTRATATKISMSWIFAFATTGSGTTRDTSLSS